MVFTMTRPAISLLLFATAFLLEPDGANSKGHAFTWKQCGKTDYIKMHDLRFSPDPISVPGNAILNLNFSIEKTFTEFDVKLTMHKDTLLGPIFVPCVFQMGSCTYRHSCSLLDEMERENWGGMSSSLATQMKRAFSDNNVRGCPHFVQNVKLEDIHLYIPPNKFGPIWDGSYKVKIQSFIKPAKKDEEIFCLDVKFSLTS